MENFLLIKPMLSSYLVQLFLCVFAIEYINVHLLCLIFLKEFNSIIA